MFARPSVRLFWAGLPLVVLGQAIRIWSAGYLFKLHNLVTAGPFALCRNPLYVGSFVGSLGYFIMCGRLELGIAGVILFWLFHGGAVLYEERMLHEKHGQGFEEYSRRVGRFVPRSFSLAGQGEFSWKMVAYNREHTSALGVLILTGVFCLISYRPDLAPAAWIFR